MAFPLAALIPSALGVISSLFGGKGKKTEYAAQQTPQQQAAYGALLRMIQQRMGKQSAGYAPTAMAMNQLGNMFYGQNVVNPQNPMPTGAPGPQPQLQQPQRRLHQ